MVTLIIPLQVSVVKKQRKCEANCDLCLQVKRLSQNSCPEQEFLTRVPLSVFMSVEGTTTPEIL